MRGTLTITLAFLGTLIAWPAAAVTLINLEAARSQVFVCDDKCGPSFGEDWGSAQDFWLDSGESRSFDCSGQCFVGLYYEGHSPTLGDMAMAEDDELFQGSETGYIQGGTVSHNRK